MQQSPFYYQKRRIGILIGVSITFLSAFLFLGETPIQEWDEARHGVNAFEMLNRGDWVNLYYGGVVDDWNLKPPLTIWLICLAYELFGMNAFGLRFFSALAGIGMVYITYLWAKAFLDTYFALWVPVILGGVTAVFGHHVARTGDTDAIFSFFSFVEHIPVLVGDEKG